MKLRYAGFMVAVMAFGAPGSWAPGEAAEPGRPAISEEASTALQQMGKTLSTQNFSFKADTIRVHQDSAGDFLHIWHSMDVLARRPNGLSVKVTGDDGSNELRYDGKTAALANLDTKKYAVIPAPSNLDAMLDEVASRLHVDFPLADFLSDDPTKSFLTGVTSGREVGTVTIDGTPHRHLFFSQSGGIELELWLEKNETAAPRRLIATYRSLPGQPNFIAEFSNWNFSVRPSDADFTFRPPAGATEVDLKAAAEAASGTSGDKR